MATQDPYFDARDKLDATVNKLSTIFEGLKVKYEGGNYTEDVTKGLSNLESDIKAARKDAKSLRKVRRV